MLELQPITLREANAFVKKYHRHHTPVQGAKFAIAVNDGAGVRDFLKTNESFEFYDRLMELIKGFAHTDHARSKLSLYFPYPSRKKEKIMQIQKDILGIVERFHSDRPCRDRFRIWFDIPLFQHITPYLSSFWVRDILGYENRARHASDHEIEQVPEHFKGR